MFLLYLGELLFWPRRRVVFRWLVRLGTSLQVTYNASPVTFINYWRNGAEGV